MSCTLCGKPRTAKHPTLRRCDEHYLEYRQSSGRASHAQTRASLFEVLGHTCVRCGFADKRALQVDHINGDGAEHRRRETNATGLLRSVKARPHLFQVLCANCNWIKKSELGENPGRIRETSLA